MVLDTHTYQHDLLPCFVCMTSLSRVSVVLLFLNLSLASCMLRAVISSSRMKGVKGIYIYSICIYFMKLYNYKVIYLYIHMYNIYVVETETETGMVMDMKLAGPIKHTRSG